MLPQQGTTCIGGIQNAIQIGWANRPHASDYEVAIWRFTRPKAILDYGAEIMVPKKIPLLAQSDGV